MPEDPITSGEGPPADRSTTDAERTAERADELTPEERAAGSDDPEAQAAAVLADSDDRQRDRSEAADGSDQVDPA